MRKLASTSVKLELRDFYILLHWLLVLPVRKVFVFGARTAATILLLFVEGRFKAWRMLTVILKLTRWRVYLHVFFLLWCLMSWTRRTCLLSWGAWPVMIERIKAESFMKSSISRVPHRWESRSFVRIAVLESVAILNFRRSEALPLFVVVVLLK